METLKNKYLTIQASSHGAELTSIRCNKTGKEYLWQADPAFWKRHSPILFPIVGSLWEGKYRLGDKEYHLPKHGFARDMDFEIETYNDRRIEYVLRSNDETRRVYPFEFELHAAYFLMDNNVCVTWKVFNMSDEDLYFQIGGHPAFYFPDFDPQTSERGFLSFDKKENLHYTKVSEKGCISKEHYPLPLDKDGLMAIDTHTFDIDTYIIEDNQVEHIYLLDKDKKPYLSVHGSFPVFGLWSPAGQNAPFMCIEPWCGRCDSVHYNGDFRDRKWTNQVEPEDVFGTDYVIHID